MPNYTKESALARLDELAKLGEGWLDDGYGRAIKQSAVHMARTFIELAGVSNFAIFPTENGNIIFEWLGDDYSTFMSLEFDPDNDNDDGDFFVADFKRESNNAS